MTVKTLEGARSELVRVSPDGMIMAVDFAALPYTSLALSEAPDDGVTFWREIPAASLSVTDFEYDDGVLYIAGLSNGEFASTPLVTIPADVLLDGAHVVGKTIAELGY